MDIRVIYGDTVDVARWETMHSQGKVPGVWPYGLEQLALHQHTVSAGPAARGGPAESETKLTFSFDERAAHTVAKHAGLRATGVIWLAEDVEGVRQQLRRLRTKLAIRKMDLVWTYSSALASQLPGLLGLKRANVHFVPLGIDTAFYAPAEVDPVEEGMVLSVGNDRSRDAKTLYEALELVHASRPGTKFVVQSNDVVPHPSFVHKVARFSDHAELRANYEKATVVAVATRHNMYTSGSTVALEAQAVGRPVVVSRTPGMDSYVSHGASGFLSPVGDPSKMAAHVLSLLQNPEKAHQMGLNGSARVRINNSTESMTELLSKRFFELVS